MILFPVRRAHYAHRLVGLIRFSSFVPSAVASSTSSDGGLANSFITEGQVEEEVAHYGLVGVPYHLAVVATRLSKAQGERGHAGHRRVAERSDGAVLSNQIQGRRGSPFSMYVRHIYSIDQLGYLRQLAGKGGSVLQE